MRVGGSTDQELSKLLYPLLEIATNFMLFAARVFCGLGEDKCSKYLFEFEVSKPEMKKVSKRVTHEIEESAHRFWLLHTPKIMLVVEVLLCPKDNPASAAILERPGIP